MAVKRLVKQVTYAGGFLAVVALAVISGVWLWRRPVVTVAVLPTPAAVTWAALEVERADVIRRGSTVDVVARLVNPNARAGVADLPITFVLLDANGEELHRQVVRAYLLPAATQPVAALNVTVPRPVARVEVVLPADVAWREIPDRLVIPAFNVFLRERSEVAQVSGVVEQQKGVVTNTGAFDLQRVDVAALAVAADGSVVGVGTTQLADLAIGEQREFTVVWPVPVEPVERVVPFVTTNIFADDALRPIIGDPAQLR